MPRLAVLLAVCLVVLAAPRARAQSHLVERAGPFAAVDLAGGPFVTFTPAGSDVSGAAGYRFGNGLDVAVLLGRGGAVADTLFPYPAEVHLGAEVAAAFGARWRLALAANVSVAGATTLVFPADGGPTTFRGGAGVIERRARVSATRFFSVADGQVRVRAGVGVFAAVRQVESTTLVFRAGGPDEVVDADDPVTERPFGVSVSLPVAVDLGRGAVLVIDPELRLDLFLALLGGVGDGQVTVRLNL